MKVIKITKKQKSSLLHVLIEVEQDEVAANLHSASSLQWKEVAAELYRLGLVHVPAELTTHVPATVKATEWDVHSVHNPTDLVGYDVDPDHSIGYVVSDKTNPGDYIDPPF